MISCHAIQRAFERYPEVCAPLLVKGISDAVRRGDESKAQYLGQISSRDLSSLYMFKTASGETGYAVVNEPTKYVITLLTVGWHQYVSGRFVFLGNEGLEAARNGS